MYGGLKDTLSAWAVLRRDEGFWYAHEVAKIAAISPLNMRPPEGFLAMSNLLERHCMRSFFGGPGTKDDVSYTPRHSPRLTALFFFYSAG